MKIKIFHDHHTKAEDLCNTFCLLKKDIISIKVSKISAWDGVVTIIITYRENNE